MNENAEGVGVAGRSRDTLGAPGPRTIVNPNERLLKSDPPDISRPGTRAMARAGGKGESPSSQLQFVFALKRNITWWDRVEDSADASCVVLHNALDRISNRSLPIRLEPFETREDDPKCHLKVDFSPSFSRPEFVTPENHRGSSNVISFFIFMKFSSSKYKDCKMSAGEG